MIFLPFCLCQLVEQFSQFSCVCASGLSQQGFLLVQMTVGSRAEVFGGIGA